MVIRLYYKTIIPFALVVYMADSRLGGTHLVGYQLISGVTTMGSDRENPGAPNHNGPNGGPHAQAVEQNHWPGPLICHNVVF